MAASFEHRITQSFDHLQRSILDQTMVCNFGNQHDRFKNSNLYSL